MSVKVMSLIWEYYPAGSGELLTALAMGDFANDDGGNIFPALDTLAKKTRQSRSTVKRHIRKMENSGIAYVVKGEAQHKAREYAFNLNMLIQQGQNEPAEIQGGQNAPGANTSVQGGHSYDPRSIIDPSYLYREEKIPTWWDQKAWKYYIAFRKKIRKPLTMMTERGVKLLCDSIGEFINQTGFTMRELTDFNEKNSNQGFFAPSKKKTNGKTYNASTSEDPILVTGKRMGIDPRKDEPLETYRLRVRSEIDRRSEENVRRLDEAAIRNLEKMHKAMRQQQ